MKDKTPSIRISKIKTYFTSIFDVNATFLLTDYIGRLTPLLFSVLFNLMANNMAL
jgi:hypothetical protein